MILVAGGSGQLGALVVRSLARRGLPVRVLTRDPARASHLADGHVEIVSGDVRDPASLAAASAGASTVVSAVHGFIGPRGVSPQTIDRDGNATVFYRGLGRAQGMAFDAEDNLYIAASLAGERGIVRITPGHEASLVVAGSNLIGLCFLPGGRAALATRDAVYEVSLG